MDLRRSVCQLDIATGVTLTYVSTGPSSGTPVLLLHAWGESLRSFDRLLSLLPVTIHAIAIDQRGHGDASKPHGDYSLKHFAADIVGFTDAARISSTVLVGSSSGGYVAQQVAVTSRNALPASSWSGHRATSKDDLLLLTRSISYQIQWTLHG